MERCFVRDAKSMSTFTWWVVFQASMFSGQSNMQPDIDPSNAAEFQREGGISKSLKQYLSDTDD
jgi:hypothetical protein